MNSKTINQWIAQINDLYERDRLINKFEKAFIWFYNAFDDWQLKWVGDQNLPYDAIGKIRKGMRL